MTTQITRRCASLTLGALLLPGVATSQSLPSVSTDPLSVELTGITLPVVRAGRLVNYLFGVIKIELNDGASTFYLRERTYLLRDAIVRIASRSPIPEGPVSRTFDRVAVTRVVLRAIEAIRPGARVVRVTVLDAALMRN